ncbi:uncharacterized protein AB675_2738 [Cyphellophora attinorum]|uniref:Vacuolar segregation protein 7 n=1 Tax=Cyphellophora attinorum TaxID=1664694 RepID=A0A0N1P442_9EURO|nr:uncharacterized protein AB675_2738 [Phialophora attinorum]KPI45130.1 hypothetical protein AB675_2738 [Phialophora attinorum]
MSGDGAADKGGLPKDPPSSSTSDQTKAREPSPLRASRSSSSIPTVSRSRKNSSEFSPTRNTALSGTLSTIPSAAAVQRALSAQRPVLTPGGADGATDTSRVDKTSKPTSSPSWPGSPRLKSPPPPASGARHPPQQKRNEADQMASNTSLKRQSVPAAESSSTPQASDAPKDPATGQSTLRPPGRGASVPAGALETVAEGSVPSTSFMGSVGKSQQEGKGGPGEPGPGQNGPSSSEQKSTSNKPADDARARSTSTSKVTSNLAKRSLTNLTTAKPKPPDPPRTMTVETEPVVTNTQILGPDRYLSGRDGSGSIRTKPSNETIRPKKEKKKTRKTPSVHAVTGSSKADIFEAKVASAVDEADTSDSDETFVYESNPPDSRSHRHHSRTPSGTSLASTEPRNRHGLRSGSHAVGQKKSMKFSNSGFNNQFDDDEDGSGRGSLRNPSTHRHHHIGRHGKTGHNSILDSNSPFSQASKSNSPRAATANVARSSRPNSPRLQNGRSPLSPKKSDPFDMYDNMADDERTPLMGNGSGSVRVNRTRHSRRIHGSGLRNSEYYEDNERTLCTRLSSCVILGIIGLILAVGVVTFVVGLNQPLLDVKVRHMQNILVSEQELMLDLHVDAVNTNIFAISVSVLDINLFAESNYTSPSADPERRKGLRWARRAWGGSSWPWPSPTDGVDEGTDPIDEPELGSQKILLGPVAEFDSPLSFDASPLRRRRSGSVGEIRLANPGNTTVDRTEQWERVIQHEFNLILRGVIKYQLPLTSKMRSVKISSKAKVSPSGDGDEDDTA